MKALNTPTIIMTQFTKLHLKVLLQTRQIKIISTVHSGWTIFYIYAINFKIILKDGFNFSYYNFYSPITAINYLSSSATKQNGSSFRFPEDLPSDNPQYPNLSPFKYGDRISQHRNGLVQKHSNGKRLKRHDMEVVTMLM